MPASRLLQSGRVFSEATAEAKTGLALANPNNETATISFYFTDANGQDFGAGSFTRAPNAHMAKFLDEEPFKLNVSAATFTFTASPGVAATAIRALTH